MLNDPNSKNNSSQNCQLFIYNPFKVFAKALDASSVKYVLIIEDYKSKAWRTHHVVGE